MLCRLPHAADSLFEFAMLHDTDLAVHDLGGLIGLFWAVRHPRRVKQLVLLNTLLYPETSWAVKLLLLFAALRAGQAIPIVWWRLFHLYAIVEMRHPAPAMRLLET